MTLKETDNWMGWKKSEKKGRMIFSERVYETVCTQNAIEAKHTLDF